jgi:exopolysaccharide production protein ExoQ
MANARSSTPLIDKWSTVPIVAFVFAAVAGQLIAYMQSTGNEENADSGSNLLNEIAWLTMAGMAIGIVAQNQSRLSRVVWPPPVLWLFACVALALASTLWSVKPGFAFIRSIQQILLISSIVLTPLLARARAADMIRPLFLCFAVGVTLNLMIGGRTIAGGIDIGYSGFMSGKNDLGQFAGIAVIMALHEVLQSGSRRALGLIFTVLATVLLIQTESKTSTALAFLSPALAWFMLTLNKFTRISSVVVLSILTFLCIYFKSQLAWYVFHDVTFTGRTLIWEFVGSEIDRRPLLGWGFLSFWLVGPDSPAMIDGPGWVKIMPHAHNGYLDITVQLGYVGLACLAMLVATAVLAIERLAKQDAVRGWLLLSMTVFIVFNNHLESSWMHSGDFLWVVFVMICAEIGRFWQVSQSTRAAQGLKPSSRPAGPGIRRTGRPARAAVGPLGQHAR